MVPGFDLFLADTLGRQNGRAGWVWGAWRRRQVIVKRLDRVLERRVVEEPGEVLGVTLRELDGQARDHAADRTRAANVRRPTGRLHVGRGRSETDDVDVREYGLAHDLGRPRWRGGANREHRNAGGRDDGDVVTEGDVAGHTLQLARRDGHGDVAAGQRQVGRSRTSRHEAAVLGKH